MEASFNTGLVNSPNRETILLELQRAVKQKTRGRVLNVDVAFKTDSTYPTVTLSGTSPTYWGKVVAQEALKGYLSLLGLSDCPGIENKIEVP